MDPKVSKNLAANPELDQGYRVEQDADTLGSVWSSVADRLENSVLIAAIKEDGYTPHDRFIHEGVEFSVYYNNETDTAVIFTDSVHVPGLASSQGALAIVPVDNRLLPAILIPAPSVEAFQNSLSDLNESEVMTAFDRQLRYCSCEGQIEVYMHERVHLQQLQEGAPWALATTANMAWEMVEGYRAQGFNPALSPSLQEALERGRPTADELIAAQLVQEIRAHAVNLDTHRERATVAIKVMLFVDEQLKQSQTEQDCLQALRQGVSAWGNFISQWANYPEPTDAALDIAARWIFDEKVV